MRYLKISSILFASLIFNSCTDTSVVTSKVTATVSEFTQKTLRAVSASGFQQGIASWYGKPFHGRKTANGERYNMFTLTAAHRTLPLGTLIKVTSLSTGKEVIVRVNDRGPYHGDRILDLSLAAAKKLDLKDKGIGEVAIQVL